MKADKYFRLAKIQAEKSSYRYQVGACLVTRKGETFFGHNDANKTHPLSHSPFNKIHAEFDVLRKVKDKSKLVGASIFVYRRIKSGQALAKPCGNCFDSILVAGIKRIYYTTDRGVICHELLKKV